MKKRPSPQNNGLHFDPEQPECSLPSGHSPKFELRPEQRKLILLSLVLLGLMAADIFLRYDFLHHPVTPARYLSVITGRAGELWQLLTGGADVNGASFSIYTILIVALVGSCLAVSGTVYQGIFHTPMASPSMLGIQSGGMLAAVLYLFFMVDCAPEMSYYTNSEYVAYLESLSFVQLFAQQIWVLTGCILGSVLVLLISSRAGRDKVSGVVLILAGSLFGSFARTGVSLGQYYFTYVDPTPNRAYALMTISMGTFANTYQLSHLLMLGIPILVCLALLLRLAPGLNLLTFGQEEARAAGMNVERFRNLAFLLCIIPCAVVLAFCGQISFVGLIVPHFARQIGGSDHRWLLPTSALLGAISMVLVYLTAVCTGLSTSINLITSVVGGILFLLFILKYRRCRNADWA